MSGGFVITCTEHSSRSGRAEARMVLEMAVDALEDQAPVRDGPRKYTSIADEVQREKKEMRKSCFVFLGSKQHADSDVLFVRNESGLGEIEIFNQVVQTVKRAKHIRRIIPIHRFFTVNHDLLSSYALELSRSMPKDGSFKVLIEKRLCSHFSSGSIIESVAQHMPFRVDLEAPTHLLVVEISRDLCGMSLLKRCPGNFNILRSPALQERPQAPLPDSTSQ